VLFERREKRGVRPAVSHRHAESLRVAENDICTGFTRRSLQDKRQEVASYRDCHAGPFGPRDELAEVVNRARFVGGLDNRPNMRSMKLDLPVVADGDLDAQRLGSRAQDFDRLGKARVGHKAHGRPDDAFDPAALHAMQHGHRFSGGGGFVQQRCIGDLHSSQVAHHRLEIEQAFQAPLSESRPGTACRACTSRGSRGTLRRITLGVTQS
jgi:hypothetical protein